MTTWVNTSKTATGTSDYYLLIGGGFYLSIGSGFKLLISPAGADGWVNEGKNSATWSNPGKNSSTWANLTKS